MRKAAQEGRPILFCINALDTENANLMLRRSQYRSQAWGTATRGYVSFPCHPEIDSDSKGMSSRYVGTTSKTANEALTYVLKRFGPNQISPQHIILEPDGDLAFRKEYYEGVVRPRLFDQHLARISPPIAFTRASIDRQAALKKLAALPDEELQAGVEALLKGSDGLAGAIALNLLEDEFGKTRRLTLIKAFAALPKPLLELGAYGADERVSWPDDESAETEAWVQSLLASNPDLGAWAAARVIARSEDKALRSRVLSMWKKAKNRGADAAIREREARVLAGDLKNIGTLPSTSDEANRWRLKRAAKKAGLKDRRWPELPEAIRDGRPAVIYGALVEADASDVGANQALVEEALLRPGAERVRIAAALALLRSGRAADVNEVTHTIVNAAFDLVEGADTRAHAVESLGEDPGDDPDQWTAAVRGRFAQVGGGR